MNEYICHENQITFTAEDLDETGTIKPERLMHYFQEVASDHVDKLDLGFDFMMRNNWIWVMTKLQYQVYDSFDVEQTYRLMTCPHPKKSVTFLRDYHLYDSRGREVAVGASQWCVLDFQTRKIQRTDIDFDGEFFPEKVFNGKIQKLHPTQLTFVQSHVVDEADLDKNLHTNNCRYGHLISQVTGKTDIRDFVIYFAKETRLGDEIRLYTQDTEEGTFVEGRLTDDVTVFQARA